MSKNNTTIHDSYKVTDSTIIKNVLHALQYESDGMAINKRTVSSMTREWKSHNILYDLHICRKRTKDVDLEYPQKWYYKIGYFILSLFFISKK